MKARAYVMIFFFWALLTIITPILVGWSQSLKTLPQLDDNDQEHKLKDGPRRMMGSYSAEMYLTREIVNRLEEELTIEAPSMAPTPEKNPVMPSTNHTSISHEFAIT